MKTFFKKIGSFFWPITTKIPSDINGDLELTWYQGVKVLDTKNANFSYGSLDKILDIAFKYTSINPTDKVLVLGLGGGNFIQKIKKEFSYKGALTAVELDAQIIKVATEEFAVSTNKNIQIIHQDALEFVNNTKKHFDFILIDVFVDNIVPDSFYDIDFWQDINSILKPKGRFVFNAGTTKIEASKIDTLIDYLKDKMIVFKKENVNNTNILIFGEK